MKIGKDQIRKYVEARFSGQHIPYRAEVSLRCPFHADSTASFSFNIEKGVWKCHAGCGDGGLIDFEQKLNGGSREDAVHRIEELLSVDHLFESRQHQPVAVYRYVDAQGQLLFEKLRYEPKRFVQRRERADGKYEYRLEGIPKPLYRLPEVLTAMDVCVCEGEKDADNVRAAFTGKVPANARFAATTNFDGAGKWREEYSKYFLGKRVVVFADNDEQGRKHAETVAASAHRYALGVRLVNLPGLAEHGDVSDYLAAHSAGELLAVIRETPQWHPTVADHKLLVETAKFQISNPPDVDWLVEGVIQKGANGLITGEPKSGKSLLMTDLLLAIATGIPWLGFKVPRRAKVGLVSREDYPGMTAQRIGALFRSQVRPTDFEGWMWINTRWQTANFSLENGEDVSQLIAELKMENVEFCCLDVFRRLHSADENDNTEMQKVLDQLVRIQAEAGCALGLVHHLSKDMNGTIFRRIRGATAIHGWTEWALALSVTNPEASGSELVRKVEFESKAACAQNPTYFQIESRGDVMRLVTMATAGGAQ